MRCATKYLATIRHVHEISVSDDVRMLMAKGVDSLLSIFATHLTDRQQLDRIEKELHYMRADLKKYFEDTKADYTAFGAALDNIDADLQTLDAKIANLEAAQAASGELTAEEQAAMAELDTARQALRTRVEAVAAETPEAPAAPPANA